MRYDLPLEEAQELVLSRGHPLGVEEVPLFEAHRRVLAREVAAPCPLPPFDRSPLDGYAVRGEDTGGASPAHPVYLRLQEEVPAGRLPAFPVLPGCCARVMTGAPLPAGANAVLAQEYARVEGDLVAVLDAVQPGDNYIRAGEDVKAGARVLVPGMVLGSGAIGMLAALGITRVAVFRRPRVAILSTGEELIPPEAPLAPGKIRNSNLYALAAAVREAGGDPVPLSPVPDRLEEILPVLRKALAQADLVVTTGGASVGAYDLIPEAFQRLGGELLFRRVAFKPGTPVAWGTANGLPLAGLSGNPAAALISFELLVRPLILRLAGRTNWRRPRLEGVLADDFPKKSATRRFVRATARFTGGRCLLYIAGGQNPGILSSILHANALLDVPAGSGKLAAGQTVNALLLAEAEPGLGGEDW